MTIREIITNKIAASKLTDSEIAEMAYGINYFYPLDCGMSREDAIWWRDNQQEFVDRLDAIKNQTASRGEMVTCSCGHTIPKNLVMSTSLGTSCQDCYDKMSK
jgi:hypothetical protein